MGNRTAKDLGTRRARAYLGSPQLLEKKTVRGDQTGTFPLDATFLTLGRKLLPQFDKQLPRRIRSSWQEVATGQVGTLICPSVSLEVTRALHHGGVVVNKLMQPLWQMHPVVSSVQLHGE